MLYNLLFPLSDKYSVLNLFKYLTFRTGGAIFTALIVCFAVGPFVIHWLKDKQHARQILVVGADRSVGGNLGNPFVHDVHAGFHAIVRGGVALGERNGFAVDADVVELDGHAGEELFAVLDAQRGKGNAGSRARFGRGEVQTHGVVARAGHGRVGRLHSGVVRAPVLARPEGAASGIAFAAIGLDKGYLTLILAHVTFCTPYVVLNVMPKLRQLDKNAYEAALDLGATPRQALHRVILPEIMPGIVTGGIMAFTMSVDDFVVSYFTAGTTSQPLSVVIYSMTRHRMTPKINAVSTLLFLFVLVLLIVINVRQSRDEKRREAARREAAS